MVNMPGYLNGPVSTEWGKKRVENGYPAPYGVKYIGIDNEEFLSNGDRAYGYDHYEERFNLLYDAIKSKDASVPLIGTAWWHPESPHMERVFKAFHGKAEYWDYHPWVDLLSEFRFVFLLDNCFYLSLSRLRKELHFRPKIAIGKRQILI